MGQQPSTIRKAIAAIKAGHRVRGLPVPDGVAALGVLRGLQDSLDEAGIQPRRAEPLPLEAVVALLGAVDAAGPAGMRDAAIVVLAHAMLTAGELAALDVGDVIVDNRPGPLPGVLLRVGDDAGGVRVLELRHWRSTSGEHHPALCPAEIVLRLRDYLLLIRGASPGSALLRPVDSHGRVAGLDAVRRGNQPREARIGPSGLTRIFAKLRARAGFPGRFTLQSLRIGGAEAARAHGASYPEVTAAGGWSPTSAAVLEHLRRWDEAHPTGAVGAYVLADEALPDSTPEDEAP